VHVLHKLLDVDLAHGCAIGPGSTVRDEPNERGKAKNGESANQPEPFHSALRVVLSDARPDLLGHRFPKVIRSVAETLVCQQLLDPLPQCLVPDRANPLVLGGLTDHPSTVTVCDVHERLQGCP
jgi:hypothetical protein